MNAIITTDRGGICGICQKAFDDQEQQITHIGGEGHDGFHKKCLKKWVIHSPTCPYDGQPIHANCLAARTEQIVAKLKPSIGNAAYVACSAAMLAQITALAGGEILSGMAAAGIAATTVFGLTRLRKVTVLATTVAGALLANPEITGGAIAVAGAIAGIGIDKILDHRRVDQIDRENIAVGLYIGSFAATEAFSFIPLAACPTIVLVGSITTGILSVIRS